MDLEDKKRQEKRDKIDYDALVTLKSIAKLSEEQNKRLMSLETRFGQPQVIQQVNNNTTTNNLGGNDKISKKIEE